MLNIIYLYSLYSDTLDKMEEQGRIKEKAN